jgi:hypothetical protein
MVIQAAPALCIRNENTQEADRAIAGLNGTDSEDRALKRQHAHRIQGAT